MREIFQIKDDDGSVILEVHRRQDDSIRFYGTGVPTGEVKGLIDWLDPKRANLERDCEAVKRALDAARSDVRLLLENPETIVAYRRLLNWIDS